MHTPRFYGCAAIFALLFVVISSAYPLPDLRKATAPPADNNSDDQATQRDITVSVLGAALGARAASSNSLDNASDEDQEEEPAEERVDDSNDPGKGPLSLADKTTEEVTGSKQRNPPKGPDEGTGDQGVSRPFSSTKPSIPDADDVEGWSEKSQSHGDDADGNKGPVPTKDQPSESSGQSQGSDSTELKPNPQPKPVVEETPAVPKVNKPTWWKSGKQGLQPPSDDDDADVPELIDPPQSQEKDLSMSDFETRRPGEGVGPDTPPPELENDYNEETHSAEVKEKDTSDLQDQEVHAEHNGEIHQPEEAAAPPDSVPPVVAEPPAKKDYPTIDVIRPPEDNVVQPKEGARNALNPSLYPRIQVFPPIDQQPKEGNRNDPNLNPVQPDHDDASSDAQQNLENNEQPKEGNQNVHHLVSQHDEHDHAESESSGSMFTSHPQLNTLQPPRLQRHNSPPVSMGASLNTAASVNDLNSDMSEEEHKLEDHMKSLSLSEITNASLVEMDPASPISNPELQPAQSPTWTPPKESEYLGDPNDLYIYAEKGLSIKDAKEYQTLLLEHAKLPADSAMAPQLAALQERKDAMLTSKGKNFLTSKTADDYQTLISKSKKWRGKLSEEETKRLASMEKVMTEKNFHHIQTLAVYQDLFGEWNPKQGMFAKDPEGANSAAAKYMKDSAEQEKTLNKMFTIQKYGKIWSKNPDYEGQLRFDSWKQEWEKYRLRIPGWEAWTKAEETKAAQADAKEKAKARANEQAKAKQAAADAKAEKEKAAKAAQEEKDAATKRAEDLEKANNDALTQIENGNLKPEVSGDLKSLLDSAVSRTKRTNLNTYKELAYKRWLDQEADGILEQLGQLTNVAKLNTEQTQTAAKLIDQARQFKVINEYSDVEKRIGKLLEDGKDPALLEMAEKSFGAKFKLEFAGFKGGYQQFVAKWLDDGVHL